MAFNYALMMFVIARSREVMVKLTGVVGAAVLVLSAAGCGGGEAQVMPDVAESRLDVALSDLDRAGVEEPEVVGGGVFGVVDESAWVVCNQEPAAGETVDSTPRLTVERECASSARDETGGDRESDSNTRRGGKSQDDTSTKRRAAAPAPVSDTFVMPPLVGANLQDAQDLLQTFDSFFLTQTDATGLERFQVLDSSWKVCGQSPPAGVETSVSTMVELAVVKNDEACP